MNRRHLYCTTIAHMLIVLGWIQDSLKGGLFWDKTSPNLSFFHEKPCHFKDIWSSSEVLPTTLIVDPPALITEKHSFIMLLRLISVMMTSNRFRVVVTICLLMTFLYEFYDFKYETREKSFQSISSWRCGISISWFSILLSITSSKQSISPSQCSMQNMHQSLMLIDNYHWEG